MVQTCLKPTTPSCSTVVRTAGWCHSVGNQVVEVTKRNLIEIGNSHTDSIKIAVENANLCGKICDRPIRILLKYTKKRQYVTIALRDQ